MAVSSRAASLKDARVITRSWGTKQSSLDAAAEMPYAADVAALTRLNAEAVPEALGLPRVRAIRRLIEWAARSRARSFALQLAEYDDRVGLAGLPSGARWLLSQVANKVEVAGQDHVPSTGASLIVANHPGLTDTLALFAGINREDLRIVAADKPFLRALPRTSEHLLYLTDTPTQRLAALRALRVHLRSGGAALTFPGGQIEADPSLQLERAVTLSTWIEKLTTLGRLCPGVPIIPCVVSGVLAPAAQLHPITRIRRTPEDREWLGATLQMLWPRYQRVTVRVAFGPAVRAHDASDARTAAERVLVTTRQLMREPPATWTTVLTATEMAPPPISPRPYAGTSQA